MDWLQAAILGLVEGLTEFLPVSSTGHLLLAERLLGVPEGRAAHAYAICIQAGAILAVLLLYFGRVRASLAGVLGRDPAGRRLAVNLVAAFVPAGVLGLLFEHRLKDLFFNVPAIAVAWVAWGVVILAVERRRRGIAASSGKGLDDLTWKGALVIGFLQCFAMWPGTSRSLVAILGGLAAGLSLSSAVEFSFLLGVLTLTAAAGKDFLADGGFMIRELGLSSLVIGFVVATVSAVASVKWMVAWLTRHGMSVFGWYRVALGVGVLAFALAGCSKEDAVADAAGDAVEVEELPEGDPGVAASCVLVQEDATAGCSHFVNVDGEGTTSMQSAMGLCESGHGTWQAGACPEAGATGECRQPGTSHFRQTDFCYGSLDPCREGCLGEFTERDVPVPDP
jgi:undecaprenyl-diphosphatase